MLGIEIQQVVALFIGTTLFSAFISWVNVAHFNQPLGTSLFSYVAIADLLYALIRLIPLFLAATYGPWVGLCTAGLGGFLAIYFTDREFGVGWPLFLGGALGAFIAGLAWLKTQGRYNDSSSIVLAMVLALIGEIVVLVLPNYVSIWLRHTSLIEATSSFLVEMLPSIILILLLFPLLLVAHSAVVRRKIHA